MSFYRPLPEHALYLDDKREPVVADWEWVWTVNAFTARLETGDVEHISLDFDLKCSDPDHSGYDVVAWMAQTGRWPSASIQLHTGDYQGSAKMAAIIDASGLFDEPIDHPLGPIYLRS